MNLKYYLHLKDNQEWLEHDNKITKYPIGTLLFSYLDIDWKPLYEKGLAALNQVSDRLVDYEIKIEEALEKEEPPTYMVLAEYYHYLLQELKPFPILQTLISTSLNKLHQEKDAAHDIAYENFSKEYVQEYYTQANKKKKTKAEEEDFQQRSMNLSHAGDDLISTEVAIELCNAYPEPCERLEVFLDVADHKIVKMSLSLLEWLVSVIEELNKHHSTIKGMILYTLDVDGEHNKFNSMQRLYFIQSNNMFSCKSFLQVYDRLLNKRLFLEDDEVKALWPTTSIDELKTLNIDVAIYYSSPHLFDLIYLEYEHMCMRNISVRKCQHCGKYFIPFSSASVYCDRPLEDDSTKTCKTVGAMTKYAGKINNDEAKKLYRKLANAYQMRCSRSPFCYHKEDYEKWKVAAKEKLKDVENGTLLFEDFAELIKLPDTK